MTHIADGDFTPVIEKALELPGFAEDAPGKEVLVGFGRNAVLGVADKVIEAVKGKDLRHFFPGGAAATAPSRGATTTPSSWKRSPRTAWS